MSTGIDKELVSAYYQRMSDAEITDALKYDVKGLTAEAQEIVKAEIKRRKLDAGFADIVDAQQQVYEHVPKAYDPDGCPVDEEKRIWIEESSLFLLDLFGEENTRKRTVLLPDYKHFPIKYDGSEETAFKTLEIVARQMEVPVEKIRLDFYDENPKAVTEGNPGGMYWGKSENGNFEISLVTKLLNEPEAMVATMAHEIAHIKLLGEDRLQENDEPLTDLATIFFGLGVFGANTAFQTSRNSRYFMWSTSGYLTQMEWGYALALFALVRNEPEPGWANFLCTNVKADFKQGQNFIANNRDKIMLPG